MDWCTFKKGDVSAEKGGPPRKKVLVAAGLVSLVLLVGVAVAGFAWAKKEITLADGDEEKVVFTYKRTVGDLLASLDIEPLGSYDLVDPALETGLRDGLKVTITRAVPVTVAADGEERGEMTTARTVGELLAQIGVKVDPEDLVQPEASAAVEPDMTVRVTRVTKETRVREVEIPYGQTREPAYNLAKGQTKEKSAGVPGLKKETWAVVLHDGEELSRELVDSEVVVEPKNQVILVGTVETVSRGGRDLRVSRSLTARATAYTYTGRNTATGRPPGPGTVAVDPAVIPLGSKLYIDGYGHGTAMDVGQAIKGNRIDVFFPTRSQALNWGSRSVKVHVLQ